MYRKNSKYYLFSILNFILLHIPIITIYFNSVVKSVTLVSIIFGVKSITVMLLEVPTGYISDRCSRKLSLALGIILNIIALLIFIVYPNFYSLIIGEVCYGISECLTSGSDIAFYYDNFKAEGRENDYSYFIKNITLLQSVFLAISFFIGSILYGKEKKSVFLITILFQLIALIVLLSIEEKPYKKNVANGETVRNHIEKNIKKSNVKLFYILLLYSAVLAIFYSLYIQLFPIITVSITDNFYLYGLVYTIVMMVYGIGAKKGCENIHKLSKVLLIMLTILIIGGIVNNDLSILFIIVITRFIWGYLSTGLNIYINKNTNDSSFRATLFSILNIMTSIFSSIFMFIMGWIIDNNIGLKYLFFLWGFILFILIIINKKVILMNK